MALLLYLRVVFKQLLTLSDGALGEIEVSSDDTIVTYQESPLWRDELFFG